MIYLISDIHGNTTRFRSVMDQICLQPEDTLYILGDVVDRFPGGIDLLQEIMGMSNAHMLLGNHEYMMLQALEKKTEYSDTERYSFPQQYVKQWHRTGGCVTHDAFDALDSARQEKILSYLKSLPLNIDLTLGGKRYKLAHGTSATRYYPYRHSLKKSSRYVDKTEFTVWERWGFGDPQPRNYTMIFGHTPTCYYQADNPLRIYKNRHIICIDCGSGYSKEILKGSRLACLRLDDMLEFYSTED
jgi:serine/threonine protein phosphatase 1